MVQSALAYHDVEVREIKMWLSIALRQNHKQTANKVDA